jgi:hypothetical protein
LLEALSHLHVGLIDWCLTPTLAVFQPYRGVSKFNRLIFSTRRPLEIRPIYILNNCYRLGLWCLTPLSTTIVIGTNKRKISKFCTMQCFYLFVLKGTLNMFYMQVALSTN